MGPNPAKAVLTEAIYMGADEGILISDRRFGGADVLATSYTLSSAIRSLETEEEKVDLVICGKQTTDGDTAQVGAEMAEYLDLLTARIQLPCVICTDAEINTPRLPSYLRKCAVDPKLDELIKVLTLDDFLDRDPAHYGLKGSATAVERIFPPETNDEHIYLTGNARENTKVLVESLKTRKLL